MIWRVSSRFVNPRQGTCARVNYPKNGLDGFDAYKSN